MARPPSNESREGGRVGVEGGRIDPLKMIEGGRIDTSKVVGSLGHSSTESITKRKSIPGQETPDGEGNKGPSPPAQFRKRKPHRLRGPYSPEELAEHRRKLLEQFPPTTEQPAAGES
jgi:hypothetical protein